MRAIFRKIGTFVAGRNVDDAVNDHRAGSIASGAVFEEISLLRICFNGG